MGVFRHVVSCFNMLHEIGQLLLFAQQNNVLLVACTVFSSLSPYLHLQTCKAKLTNQEKKNHDLLERDVILYMQQLKLSAVATQSAA